MAPGNRTWSLLGALGHFKQVALLSMPFLESSSFSFTTALSQGPLSAPPIASPLQSRGRGWSPFGTAHSTDEKTEAERPHLGAVTLLGTPTSPTQGSPSRARRGMHESRRNLLCTGEQLCRPGCVPSDTYPGRKGKAPTTSEDGNVRGRAAGPIRRARTSLCPGGGRAWRPGQSEGLSGGPRRLLPRTLVQRVPPPRPRLP